MVEMGIRCPNCDKSNYSGKQGTKGDNLWTRKKECKECGATFTTIEVPLGLVEVKVRKPKDEIPVTVIQPVETAAAIIPVVGEVPAAHPGPLATVVKPVEVSTGPDLFNTPPQP